MGGRPAVLRVLSPLARCCENCFWNRGKPPEIANTASRSVGATPSLESGNCSEQIFEDIRKLARVSDLGAKGVWPDPETKEAVKRVFEELRTKIDQVVPRLAENRRKVPFRRRTAYVYCDLHSCCPRI